MNSRKIESIFQLSYFNSNVIFGVITSPNSTFVKIRDNDERYFLFSVGVFLLASIIGLLVMVPFVMMPLNTAYYETFAENQIDVDIPVDWSDALLFIGVGIITGIISNVLFYFIGRTLDGNKNWKKVFSVLFFAYVPTIPMMLLLSVLVFLMWASFVAIDPSHLMAANFDEEEIFSLIGPVLSYVGLLVIVAIVFIVWIFIVLIKAVKTVNEFGTAKSFGLIVLVMFITSIVTVPLGM